MRIPDAVAGFEALRARAGRLVFAGLAHQLSGGRNAGDLVRRSAVAIRWTSDILARLRTRRGLSATEAAQLRRLLDRAAVRLDALERGAP